MKLSKLLQYMGLITLISLAYVHQQTEIYRLAYDGQKKTAYFKELLDRNTILRYNIEKNASLTRIGERISDNKDYQMPEVFCLVKQPYLSPAEQPDSGKESILARIFGIKAQAEAKTLDVPGAYITTTSSYFDRY